MIKFFLNQCRYYKAFYIKYTKALLVVLFINCIGLNYFSYIHAQNLDLNTRFDNTHKQNILINNTLNNDVLKNWLYQLQQKAKIRNFSGTLVMQKYAHNNVQTKTFNITHFFDGQSEYERLLPLEGKNRSILRINQMVQAYIEDKQVIISSKREDASFPSLGNNIGQISQVYRLRSIANERILGKETQVFILEPNVTYKDNHYSYKIWVDSSEQIILKLQTLWQDKLLEQVFFSNIQNIPVNKVDIEQWMSYGQNWKYKLPNQQEIDIKILEAKGWRLPKEYNGYAYIKTIEKKYKQQNVPMYQVMYSNGLASVSLFLQNKKEVYGNHASTQEIIEPLVLPKNIYKPIAHKNNKDYVVIAVGDAPNELLQNLTDGIKYVK
jgi:sigma-E factor negative regulatory protein RseB